MLNFSGIKINSFLGLFLRRLGRFLPQNTPIPIIQGPLRGWRWTLGSGVLGYWLGSYEIDNQKIFISLIKPGDIVFDIGAQAGFYTLLASKLVGQDGKVFSFEPFPKNFGNIRKHLALNRINNAEIFEIAVSDRSGELNFASGNSVSTGAISESGEILVKTRSLDDLLDSGKIYPPKVIKMDIEGAEFLALSGAKNIIQKYKPSILLATHGVEVKNRCLELLKSYDYKFIATEGGVELLNDIIAIP